MTRAKAEFGFGYKEIQDLTGLEYRTVLMHRVRGLFDPNDLWSLFCYFMRYGKKERLEECILTIFRSGSLHLQRAASKETKEATGKRKRKEVSKD